MAVNEAGLSAEMNILDVINQMEKDIEDASRVPLSNKVMVNGDKMLEYIDRIRALLPEEVRQANQVLTQSDQLLRSVEEQGRKILEDSRRQAAAMIEQSEIVSQATRQANEIVAQANAHAQAVVDEANRQARELSENAANYVDTILSQLEANLDHVASSVHTAHQNWKNS